LDLQFSCFAGFHPASPELNYAKKPSSIVFESFLRKFNPNNHYKVIFIDDKLKNVEAAEKYGMIGLRYLDPVQLSTALQRLLVL
jgi:histidinol phosphatase-like enzyme